MLGYAPAISLFPLEQSKSKQFSLQLISPASHPIHLRMPQAKQYLIILMLNEKGKAYSTVSYCCPVPLPCFTQCCPHIKPKKSPAAILFILPALAPAPRWYVLATYSSAAKWKTLMLWRCEISWQLIFNSKYAIKKTPNNQQNKTLKVHWNLKATTLMAKITLQQSDSGSPGGWNCLASPD